MREVYEEFGLSITEDRIVWRRRYPTISATGAAYFFVAEISDAEVAVIRFGPEGQHWEMMKVAAFLAHDFAVPQLQARLADYLATVQTLER